MAGRYLFNSIDPNCASQPNTFRVDEAPYILSAVGLAPGDTVAVERLLSGTCTVNGRECNGVLNHWVPFIVGGCVADLSVGSPSIVVAMPGSYRVNLDGVTSASYAVHAEEKSELVGRFTFTSPIPSCVPQVECPPGVPVGVVSTWG